MKSGPPPSNSEQTSFPITNDSKHEPPAVPSLHNTRRKKAPEIREERVLLFFWRLDLENFTCFHILKKILGNYLFYIKLIFYEVSQTIIKVVSYINIYIYIWLFMATSWFHYYFSIWCGYLFGLSFLPRREVLKTSNCLRRPSCIHPGLMWHHVTSCPFNSRMWSQKVSLC
jgi:hypothetical protein